MTCWLSRERSSNSVTGCQKTFRIMLLPFLFWLIMIVQFIEHGQLVIPTGSVLMAVDISVGFCSKKPTCKHCVALELIVLHAKFHGHRILSSVGKDF